MDNKTVNHIATLARIGIDPGEVDEYAADLSRILEFVAQMNAVDTADVAPLTHPRDRLLRMREDRVTEFDQRDEFQRVAPSVETGLYLVPRVIE
ncbi:MAG: Asp-tRNA(Asn)/Glu-tRNA(Gln) amidotransferase subunit GatC [Gammaproteobacteria bacterium]|nr:Asp-tRNA(Asn)/Glu-tRNA(Gln) amidotransferase subunit GatC [Gammaproteobacteria bacterium]